MNSDLIGYSWQGSGAMPETFLVTGTCAWSAQYLELRVITADDLVLETCRPAAVVRAHKLAVRA